MKTTLQHLTKPRKELVMRVVEIIKEVVNPEMIILYGSFANGKFTSQRYFSNNILYEYTSDIDFLVITKTVPKEEFELHHKVNTATEKLKEAVNMEIHDIDHINKGLSFGQYFFSDIKKEGIILYDAGTVELAEPKVLTPAEQKEVAQQYFNIWFANALGHMKGTRFYLFENELKHGVFALHQAAESFYYTVLLVFTGYKPKTHRLLRLRNQTADLSKELADVFPVETKTEERPLFELLRKAYIDARYNPDYTITKEELTALTDMVAKMQTIVEQLCLDKIASFS